MQIPSDRRARAQFAADIIRACTTSRSERIGRGLAYKNLYLTGNENGVPQSFLRTQDFIQDCRAMLYSPSGLRFRVNYFGQVSQAERAKGEAAASALHQRIINNDIDDQLSDVVLWSLIKGKVIHQIVWSRNGPEPYLIQPEQFGVYNEAISSLNRQEAFVHTSFPTRSRFKQIISSLPDAKQTRLMRSVESLQSKSRGGEDVNSTLKQIIVGNLYPYQQSGTAPVTGGGMVSHLFSPQPVMQPSVMDALVPMDEAWIWNDAQDDWATITMVGDEIVFGDDMLFNAFSHDFRTKATATSDDDNPLKGRHGFVEYCAMPLDGYFWGISYVYMVALLQHTINRRIDGINMMLRKQEDPPRFMSGSTSINQNAYAKLNKPGGYFTDGSPNAKIADLTKEIPADIWRSFHEINGMFDIVGGFPAIMRGEGEGSVRSQGQSDALMRTGAARHLDAALKIERSVSATGALIFDMLRIKDNTNLTAWVMPNTKSVEIDTEPNSILEPPAPGMLPVTFQFKHISDDAKIAVDSHSASPAFRHEQRELAFALAKIGAASPERVVEMTHPGLEDELIEDAQRKKIEQAELIRQHPELLEKGMHKKK